MMWSTDDGAARGSVADADAYKAFYRIFDAFSYLSIRTTQATFLDRSQSGQGYPAIPGTRCVPTRNPRFGGFQTDWRGLFAPETNVRPHDQQPVQEHRVAKKAFSLSATCRLSAQFLRRVAVRLQHNPRCDPRGLAYPLPRPGAARLTTVILVILFFGSVEILASGAGEYIGRILEESKRRPHFIRRSIIKNGEARSVTDAPESSER